MGFDFRSHRLPVRWFISFSVLLAMVGCSSVDVDTPPASDSLLVEIFVDLTLAEARAQLHSDIAPGFRDSVLAHYGYDSTRFAERMDFYAENPKAYVNLQRRVIEKLNIEKLQIPR